MDLKSAKAYITLLIRVPRENETGPIVAEQIFSAIHGVKNTNISFEIANTDGMIKFYVHLPEELRTLIEGQIYAQYPTAEISYVRDYASVHNYNGMMAELGLTNAEVFPIKRYSQFEDRKSKVGLDALASITSTLAKFNDTEEQAWIQIVIRPLNDRWRRRLTRGVRLLGNGQVTKIRKLISDLYSSRNWLIRLFLWPLFMFLRRDEKDINFTDVEEQFSKSHEKETTLDAAMDKVGKILYESKIRIVYIPKKYDHRTSVVKLREIAGSFKQFNLPQFNGFEIKKIRRGADVISEYRKRNVNNGFVLNVEELASIFHLPNITVTTPNIFWVKSKKLEPPQDLPANGRDITIMGKTNFRNTNDIFGIKNEDRRRHLYVIGKTGMGKSTLLENMIFSDIYSNKGIAVIDPHGDLADTVVNFIPSKRTNDVIIFDPSDRDYPVAFNMLENIDPALNSIVCSGLIGIFKKIYANSWGPRLEHILRNCILSLLEYPGSTILGIPRILQDKEFRKRVILHIKDPVVKRFWTDEFDRMDPRQQSEAISPILNKVGQFLSSPIIRNILGQSKISLDLRFSMDKKKIIIVNLSKGKIGEDNSSLLGALLITKFQIDAMSRANIPEKDRTDFFLYVDEFQNFATDSFATILSEARKYRLNITMANQYIAQIPEQVRDAVFGNVGSVLSFQVGFDDADYLSKQFGEQITPNDLVSLNRYTAYLRLLIDGMPSNTFSMDSLPPPEIVIERGRIEKIIGLSRQRYAVKREIIEDKIKRWTESSIVKQR